MPVVTIRQWAAAKKAVPTPKTPGRSRHLLQMTVLRLQKKSSTITTSRLLTIRWIHVPLPQLLRLLLLSPLLLSRFLPLSPLSNLLPLRPPWLRHPFLLVYERGLTSLKNGRLVWASSQTKTKGSLRRARRLKRRWSRPGEQNLLSETRQPQQQQKQGESQQALPAHSVGKISKKLLRTSKLLWFYVAMTTTKEF